MSIREEISAYLVEARKHAAKGGSKGGHKHKPSATKGGQRSAMLKLIMPVLSGPSGEKLASAIANGDTASVKKLMHGISMDIENAITEAAKKNVKPEPKKEEAKPAPKEEAKPTDKPAPKEEAKPAPKEEAKSDDKAVAGTPAPSAPKPNHPSN